MSDNVSNEMQLDCMDFIDWDAWEASGWDGIEHDAAHVGGTDILPDPLLQRTEPTTSGVHQTANYHELQLSLQFEDSSTCLAGNLQHGHSSDIVSESALFSYPNQDPMSGGLPHSSASGNVSVASAGETTYAVPTSARGVAIQQHRRNLALSCPNKECTHQGTFHRPYELERHIRVRHQSAKPFSCPYVGCFKGSSPPSFARSDKLIAHIRSVHGREVTRQLKCPAEGCEEASMELDLLGMHIKKRHEWYIYRRGHGAENLRAIVNPASSTRLHCALWSCAKSLSRSSLIPHLLSHTLAELDSIVHELRAANFLLVHGSSDISPRMDPQHNSPQRSMNTESRIYVLCPMCGAPCKDLVEFEKHFDESHAIVEEHKVHFQVWKQYVQGITTKSQKKNVTFNPWETWWLPIPFTGAVRCPHCGSAYIRRATCDWESFQTHHQKMLADSKDIKPYRREILKLYPDFDAHPVWDDMK